MKYASAPPGLQPDSSCHIATSLHATQAVLPCTGQGPPRRVLHLSDLLGDAPSVDILHSGQTYRLQLTKAGKLILTK